MEGVEFNCNTASYKDVTLYDLVYEHHCFLRGWEKFLDRGDVKEEIGKISATLAKDPAAKNNQIEPLMWDVFNAFKNIGLNDIKVVILGQDPTPQPGQATGLAFSLKPGEEAA